MPLSTTNNNLISDFKSYLLTWIPVLKTVTVEPAALLLMTSSLMSYLISQDLIIDRVCSVNLNLSKDVCTAIVKVNATFEKEEMEIQKIAAEIRTHRSIIDHSVPLIFLICMGPWSDVYGRKVPMFIGAFGYFVYNICMIACSYFETIDGRWVGFITTTKAFFGSEAVFVMAAYSYITDTTDNSVRTIRTGLLSAGYTLGVPLGFAIGGAVSDAQLGYISSFSISAAFSLSSCLIILFAVKNTTKPDQPITEDEGGHFNVGLERENTKWWKVLNPRYSLKNILTVPFKRRPNSGRLYICLLFIALTFVLAPIHGEFGVMYLYLRNRLSWNAGDYGYFSTYTTIIGVAGVIVSMGLLSHLLKLTDPAVGFISGLSQFGGCLIYSIATTSPVMYLAPAVDMMNGTMAVIAKSMISKIAFPGEIGTVFTLLAIIESLVPLAMDPIYSTLYKFTVETSPGAFFILSAALTVPPQAIYAWLVWRDGTILTKPKPVEQKDDSVSKIYTQCALNPAFSSTSIDKDFKIDQL